MKTLDEVIETAPYVGTEWTNDALYYLKEYRMQLDDIVAKRKVLSFKIKQYDEMVETVKKQGQEHEDRCQAEIARYQEAVRNCEEAENKFRKMEDELNDIRREHIEQMKRDDDGNLERH